MDIFKGQNLLEFSDRFKSDDDCRKYLSEVKWESGYSCRNCGHSNFQARRGFSRICNICSKIESATANTLFHKVKFGIRKAFFICFEMSTTTKSLSASYMAVRYGVSENTARLFMHKVREAMRSGGGHPMDGNVHVDEFVVGGREESRPGRSYDSRKKKVVCAVQLTDSGKVRRFYALRIKDFSSASLTCIFDKHISVEAKITTDEWRGYGPIAKKYPLSQIPSNNGMNFRALHTMIHQVKSWIRTTYSWVSEKHIERYLNEFSYRLNRSQSKATVFNNLIKRMVKADKIYHAQIVGS